jgi:hypothetical protein
MRQLERGHVDTVTFTGNFIEGRFKNREVFRTYAPAHAEGLVDSLLEKGAEVNARDVNASSWAGHLISWTPIVIMIGFPIFFMRQMQGTPAAMMGRIWEVLAGSDTDLSLDELAAKLSMGPGRELKRALFQMLREQTIVFTSEKKYRVKRVD